MKSVLTPTRIRSGIWEGLLQADVGATPNIRVTLLDHEIAGVAVVPIVDAPGQFAVRVPIPSDVISDGVHTFLLTDPASDARLGHFTIVAGTGLEDDIRAEVDLLRAELDMLKKAFRRHCLETM